MNRISLIYSILAENSKLNKASKYRFIYKYKKQKLLDKYINEFMKLDIFDISNNFMTFISTLSSNNIAKIQNIKFNDKYLTLYLSDKLNISYFPRSNRFEVNDDTVSYSVYRNTKYSNTIKIIWEPTTMRIKQKYLDIILQMSQYLFEGEYKK